MVGRPKRDAPPMGANSREVAEHLFCSAPVILKYLSLGVIEKLPDGTFDLDECRRRTFGYLREGAAGRKGRNLDGPDLSTERAKLAQVQTEGVKLKNAVASGEYIPISIVEDLVERRDIVVREKILIIPGACADQLASKEHPRDEVETILRDRCYEALNELSDPRTFDYQRPNAALESLDGEGANLSRPAETDTD